MNETVLAHRLGLHKPVVQGLERRLSVDHIQASAAIWGNHCVTRPTMPDARPARAAPPAANQAEPARPDAQQPAPPQRTSATSATTAAPRGQEGRAPRGKITLPIVLHRDLHFAAACDAWKDLTDRVVQYLTRGHKRRRATTEEPDEPPRRRLRSHGPAGE
ncbi:hypothetical protein SDRG_15912 [Saprolegnia diclina VS20]|uniref:Uncharacterized protein n=1 Tax=Saprolegnia diclina (strain VS20) TaxID=1156394 RepID=T0PVF0_SAPDV|nr:hypothetical protein SDRG_15912 [Saprolegnia diclina VS20]EQC26251.1 hypothetical protein SDRG_15912 [Saprolegnia diclina VS20]|eukprot:XP_008620320.1 hypothetical protein SDRG_15912 [Saprolegnia diclina VS20]